MAAYDVISVSVGIWAMAPLVTLWLRLRFRLHRERERRNFLQAATALPAGSRLPATRPSRMMGRP